MSSGGAGGGKWPRFVGNQGFSLLEGTTDRQSSLVRPGRAKVDDRDEQWPRRLPTKIASRLRANPEFAAKVHHTLTPGTTVIITDQPVVRKTGQPRGPRGLAAASELTCFV